MIKLPEKVKAGQKVGPGKYVCLDCGKELELDAVEQDLRKCPQCACGDVTFLCIGKVYFCLFNIS